MSSLKALLASVAWIPTFVSLGNMPLQWISCSQPVSFALQIPLPPVDERKKVVEDVDKDRRYAIDAAVVRTMKSRKVLKHQQLVLEVVQQLQRMFHPDFRLIKKRIEDLISREYLERDKDDPNTFKYMA